MAIHRNVHLASFNEQTGQFHTKSDTNFDIEIKKAAEGANLIFYSGGQVAYNVVANKNTEVSSLGSQSLVVSLDSEGILLRFPSQTDVQAFQLQLNQYIKPDKGSIFEQRTEEASAAQYFQFYGYLSQQQNMMQDYIRTSTYQRSMLANPVDFNNKVVLDVGAGSGILSFFAVQAGARKVYGIEASSMAVHAKELVHQNKLSGKIVIVPGKVEEVEIPEPVDVIISEPMGYMLFNERMLESFLHAKKWLKPGGKMYPSRGDLHVAPFSDEALYMEQYSKANFWYQQSFHGVDLMCLRDAAVQEYFKQPIVDTFDIRICLARSVKHTVDFQTAAESALYTIEIPLTYSMLQTGTIHGLAFWFDVAFLGSQQHVWLSTAPTEPLTHWYQVLCLLQTPVFVKQGQTLTGKVTLKANKRQSYDVEIEINIPGTNNKSVNSLDLKNPFFRYTGHTPQPPPGQSTQSPTEAYWSTMQIANAAPVNPGSIPSVGFVSQGNATRTSVGGGISPAVFTTQNHQGLGQSNQFPVSNQFMIGDYVMPGNIMLPDQSQPINMKTNSSVGQH
ncbi:histone-arginine methyltransferase CARMER isoform X2 [Lingula anatina]|uniref:type I protein arginine methyltransferase n=1 Tax=Lingula anatina TaxID=7574 RepID=A0A1S3JBJ2_LINAN|nr:histone-arginine methyltransferase CARMER isoform X2 [Lingula anatina]|eukprot:XP_013407254.1 histone-arginine methyltransferase CARMER isoform X2 [Lingula anatina]